MGCQCNECVNLPQSVSQTQGIRGGKEGEHNTADYEDSESDSDASIDERQALEAEVSDIMRSVFGDGNDSSEEL